MVPCVQSGNRGADVETRRVDMGEKEEGGMTFY